ncbi:2Fe-2S iron-sulfur cluster-binding protein [Halogeometricum luteum]|uniref:(2Fe-2S)-binding protein n=1 Tax=Halogeometricum luteum TaxID=2950537 RepID=A0ABU2FVH3_9EURY|nr:2Fe-2S iron-sulfur cluster-binding protein [Halogeometricum sp. S3BR5-2]MDS0292555.1 (2Fe-2S)-binding protein [Halogeometricum sp. S3BR5-2]
MNKRHGDGDGNGASGDENRNRDEVRVLVRHGNEETETFASVGETLRDHLLDCGLSPYTRLTERANCGGNGLCATCGVRIREGEPAPEHWHDRLAARFGYPRLSCQIRVREPMTVELVEDKYVWGGRE